MKLYRTTDKRGNVLWGGSQEDATQARKALREAAEETSRDFATSEAIDVPTNKADLLAWLNARKV